MPRRVHIEHYAYPAVQQHLAAERMSYPVADWLNDQAKGVVRQFLREGDQTKTTFFVPLTAGKRVRAEVSILAGGYRVWIMEIDGGWSPPLFEFQEALPGLDELFRVGQPAVVFFPIDARVAPFD